MSSSIDKRVVSMEFDNSKFEKNVGTTQKTLAKLKEMLNLKDAGKGFDDIDKAAGRVNFSAIEKALQTVSSRFSNFGIIGMTVLQNLTNRAVDAGMKIGNALTSAITQGGKNRALNLEAARFQLEGLHADVDAVMDDVNYAVKGTAYGLDAAAKVASQLVASQVQSGDAMKTALRSISGVAAMTNSSYEDIGQIYTTVAGNGRLMSDQLLQFSSRGLNAASTLGQYLNKSEAEVREMVTKGQIDFATFAEAMDKTFGDHAKDANQTFTGALSNMKAALSRIGAAFYTPGLEYAKRVINALTPVIDDAKKGLEPFFKLVEKGMELISTFAVDALGKLDLRKTFNYFSFFTSSLVPGFKNIAQIATSVFSSIKSAFTSVFPPIENLNSRIINFGNAFSQITRKLKPSEETLDKIRRIFQGLFSAVSLAVKIILSVGSVFGKLLSFLSPFGGKLLAVVANIGDFITGLNNAANESEIFSKAVEGVHKALDFLGNRIATVYSTLKDFFSNFMNNAVSALTTVGDKLKQAFGSIFTSVGKFGSDLVSTLDFSKILNILTTGLIGGVLIKLFTTLGFIKKSFGEFFDLLKKAFDDGESDKLMDKVKGLFDQLTSTLGEFQQSIKANILIKIAIAMGILAASCYALAQVDPKRLVSSLTAITVMFADLFAFMGAFTKILDARSFINIDLVSGAMIKLAAAVLILSFAVEKLGKLRWQELIKGLSGVMVLCFTLGKTIQKARFDSLSPATFIGLMGLALSIRILASSVAKLGSMDFISLVKGLYATIAVLGSLVGFLVAFEKIGVVSGKDIAVASGGLILLATAMVILSSAVSKLGNLPLTQLVKGLAGFTVVLGTVIKAMELLPNSAMVLASATAMIEMAIAMNLLALAISKLGGLSVKELAKGLGAMAGALGILVGVLGGLSAISNKLAGGANFIVIATAIGILAISINLLVPALQALGAMSVEGIVKSLAMLAGVLMILGGAASVLTPVIPMMFALSGAIALFGVGIAALGAGVVMLAAGFASLAGLSFVLVETLTAVVTALISLIPKAATAMAEGLVLFITTVLDGQAKIVAGIEKLIQSVISAFSRLLPQIIDLITNTLSQLMTSAMTLMPQFIELVVATIHNLIAAVTELLPDIIELGMNLILSLLEGISNNIYQIAIKATEIIVNFINAIAVQLPAIIQAGFDLMLNFLNGLADGIRNNMGLVLEAVWNVISAIIESVLGALLGAVGSMLSAGMEFIQGAIDGIGQGIEWAKQAIGAIILNVVNAIVNAVGRMLAAGSQFIKGAIDGISRGIEGARTAVASVVQGAIDTVGRFVGNMLDAGKNLIQGLIDGIANMGGKVVEAIGNLANSAIDTVKSWFGIASPSKVFKQIGVYVIQGLVIGVESMSTKVDRAMATTGSNAIRTMKETLANVGRELSDDISSDITITPVLDLTNVNEGIDSIYSSFNRPATVSLNTMAIGTTKNKALAAFRSDEAVSVNTDSNPGQVIYNNYDLTQNNYSPKPLSRIDIYRDTKNQFSRLKGAITQ